MKRRTSRIAWAGILRPVFACGVSIGLWACSTQSSPPPPPSPSASPGAATSVRVTFYGSIAFVPTNPSDIPMGMNGTADSVMALLPRAHNIKKLDLLNIPNRAEFDPLGEPHKAHHLMLKVPAANLNVSGPDEVVLPLPPPSNDTDVYRISVTGLSNPTGNVSYSGFDKVAPVLKAFRPQEVFAPSNEAVTGSAALARMTMGPGWRLSVPSAEARTGEVARLVCTSGTSGPDCSQQQAPSSSRLFATAIQADAPQATGAVAIEVTGVGGATWRLPLQPDSGGSIQIKVLNGPLDEMYGGPPMVYPMHHFKLFYLMAQTLQGPYYYPHLAPHASPSPAPTASSAPAPENDPFCTPLAQFLAR